jgi:hypothetical protein
MFNDFQSVITTHMTLVVNVFNESSSPCIDCYGFVPN